MHFAGQQDRPRRLKLQLIADHGREPDLFAADPVGKQAVGNPEGDGVSVERPCPAKGDVAVCRLALLVRRPAKQIAAGIGRCAPSASS